MMIAIPTKNAKTATRKKRKNTPMALPPPTRDRALSRRLRSGVGGSSTELGSSEPGKRLVSKSGLFTWAMVAALGRRGAAPGTLSRSLAHLGAECRPLSGSDDRSMGLLMTAPHLVHNARDCHLSGRLRSIPRCLHASDART